MALRLESAQGEPSAAMGQCPLSGCLGDVNPDEEGGRWCDPGTDESKQKSPYLRQVAAWLGQRIARALKDEAAARAGRWATPGIQLISSFSLGASGGIHYHAPGTDTPSTREGARWCACWGCACGSPSMLRAAREE